MNREPARNAKPIVFLSHSSADKELLAPLKDLLHKRAAGAVRFFLSSDGKSLPLGQNWIVELQDALAEAKLMFVFLSRNSVDSHWVLFESGVAYGRDVKVVPVCLPGIDFDSVAPPLSHLQGFNLHSNDAMRNLARVCNEVIGIEMEEAFSSDEFDSIFFSAGLEAESYFKRWTPFISEIIMRVEAEDILLDSPMPRMLLLRHKDLRMPRILLTNKYSINLAHSIKHEGKRPHSPVQPLRFQVPRTI